MSFQQQFKDLIRKTNCTPTELSAVIDTIFDRDRKIVTARIPRFTCQQRIMHDKPDNAAGMCLAGIVCNGQIAIVDTIPHLEADTVNRDHKSGRSGIAYAARRRIIRAVFNDDFWGLLHR